MRATYNALDARIKTLIEGLVCEHSRISSKGAPGFSLAEKAVAPVPGATPPKNRMQIAVSDIACRLHRRLETSAMSRQATSPGPRGGDADAPQVADRKIWKTRVLCVTVRPG